MQKEVTPVKPASQKISYKYAGKETLTETIGKAIPQQLVPTKRVGTMFGLIVLAVIILAVFQFPFGSLMSGNTDVVVNIGYPWIFLEFALTGEAAAKPIGLILDLILYLILAYAIDVSLSLILKNPLLKSETQLKQKPAVFKDRKQTIAEKVTEKVIKK
jgi:hypothetical protein